MIRHNVVQGTPEWEKLRIGIPTASNFDKIITPKKLQPSTEAPKYRNQLVAEYLLGYSIDWNAGNGWTDRGTNMEAEARAFYELQRGIDVDLIGFVTRDDGKVGGSPDGFVGEDGGVDFKCPAIHTHIGYLIDPQTLVDKYRGQMNGYLYLTGRAWWDIVAYSPVLPAVEVRIERDEKYIAALASALDAFVVNLDAVKEQLAAYKNEPVNA